MAGQLTVPSDASRPADGLCCHTVKLGLCQQLPRGLLVHTPSRNREPQNACRRFAPEPVLQVEVCKPGRAAALAQADQTQTKPCRTQAAAHVILDAARTPALDWLTQVD